MRKFNVSKNGKKIQKGLHMLPSMGIAFIVLGVIILAASFALSLQSNFLLFAGLLLIVAGGIGYIVNIARN